MIEAIIIEYLKTRLNIQAYAEIPLKKPKSFVIVEKIGGGEANHIKATTVSVFSYASTLYGAAELDEKVRDAMAQIVEDERISSCKIGGEYRNIDSENKEYRYETIFNLFHY